MCSDTLEAVAVMLEEKAAVLHRKAEDYDQGRSEMGFAAAACRAREDELLLSVIKIRAMKGTELYA